MPLRQILVVAAIGVVAAVLIFAFVIPGGDDGTRPLPARVDPTLPDLTVSPLSGITGALAGGNIRSVRFGVMIVNQGAGDFLLRATRSNVLSDDWRVTQRVLEAGGGYTEVTSDATLVYGGDGHGHWHIKEVESHTIESLDGEVLGTVVKNGFCFFDTNKIDLTLEGAPTSAQYRSRGCGTQIDSAVTMGLSVGWGDEYPWHLFEQEIDITGLTDGTYLLRAVADPFGWFEELDETNNETTTEITLRVEDEIPYIEEVGASPAPSTSP
jgi:hypothetical protein